MDISISKIFKDGFVQIKKTFSPYFLCGDAWYLVDAVDYDSCTVSVINDNGKSILVNPMWINDYEPADETSNYRVVTAEDLGLTKEDELSEPSKDIYKDYLEVLLYKDEDEEEFPSAYDSQEGGSHYKEQGIQPKAYIKANNLNFDQGNVVKYVTRFRTKNGAEDLKKVIHYARFLLEDEYGIRSKVEYNG